MKEQVFLSKNYTIIESGIPFTMIFNRKDSSASSGEDVIYMKSGWYIFDNNKLLPWEVEGVKNQPKYNCWLDYDETKIDVEKGVNFKWYTTWINPKSIESLDSDILSLESTQYKDITDKIDSIISVNNSVKKSLTSFDAGTVLNELEQMRTVLKSSATAGSATPWGSILTALAELKTSVNKVYKHLTSFVSTQGYSYEVYDGTLWGLNFPPIIFEVLTIVVTSVSGPAGMTYASKITVSGFDKSGATFKREVSATGPFSGYDLHVVYAMPTYRGF